jgi:hypothetical protein
MRLSPTVLNLFDDIHQLVYSARRDNDFGARLGEDFGKIFT